MALLRKLWSDDSGNVAGAFALSVFPVIGLAGAAVDYSRATKVQSNLQLMTDAKAAAARVASDDARVNVALGLFRNEASPGEVSKEATATVSGKTVLVTARDHMKTGLLGA